MNRKSLHVTFLSVFLGVVGCFNFTKCIFPRTITDVGWPRDERCFRYSIVLICKLFSKDRANDNDYF